MDKYILIGAFAPFVIVWGLIIWKAGINLDTSFKCPNCGSKNYGSDGSYYCVCDDCGCVR